MAVTFMDIPLQVLTDLVNGWGTLPREGDGRGDAPYRPVADITAHLGLPARVDAGLTPQALVHAADRLYPVFSAQDAETCARHLTRLLADSGVRPALGAGDGGSLRAVWSVDDAEHALLATAAISLRQYLAAHGFARIGVCTARNCADVYLDQSPGGRRRFCSVTCQNRTRVAAFRSRKTVTG
ncbi:CGNR zinc finger domain-containing protein [Streptomyces sp. NPDC087440]|uniref:CGNR zinc finger domain-containing protein n=1 Tax=Streptomyces sp. NPDC087440 TaxID=3365790 RepID=UPI0037FAAD5C